MKRLYIFGMVALAFTACKPNLSTKAPSKGNADFTTYLAVGNSLTAGYADNSLYRSGQLNSYPQRLAEQFAQVQGGTFKQPLLPGESGYPASKLVLKEHTSCSNVTSIVPYPFSGPFDTAGSLTNISANGPYNNVGIPGIRCADYLTPGYAAIAYSLAGAPYAYRFFKNPGTDRPLDVALQVPATFFTCWLGSNDVLGYATAGGQGTLNGTPLSPTTSITDPVYFKMIYDSVVNSLTRNGAKGVLLNIPDITSIPFFTTIPANGLVLRKGQADTLNLYYAAHGVTNVHFTAGANYFIIQDHNGNSRQAVPGELILLTTPTDSLTCAGWGSIQPIKAQYVLTADEISNIQANTATFNSIIQAAATAHNLAYIDMYSYLHTLSAGITFNGVSYNAAFVTGGAFSLDGVHLTQRGYAIVANHIIDAINAYYKSTIPSIDVNKYQGIAFPAGKL